MFFAARLKSRSFAAKLRLIFWNRPKNHRVMDTFVIWGRTNPFSLAEWGWFWLPINELMWSSIKRTKRGKMPFFDRKQFCGNCVLFVFNDFGANCIAALPIPRTNAAVSSFWQSWEFSWRKIIKMVASYAWVLEFCKSAHKQPRYGRICKICKNLTSSGKATKRTINQRSLVSFSRVFRGLSNAVARFPFGRYFSKAPCCQVVLAIVKWGIFRETESK